MFVFPPTTAKWDLQQFRPFPPHGQKYCRTCLGYLSIRDDHTCCHHCRYPKSKCEVCGKTFKPKNYKQPTCSRSCGGRRGRRTREARRV